MWWRITEAPFAFPNLCCGAGGVFWFIKKSVVHSELNHQQILSVSCEHESLGWKLAQQPFDWPRTDFPNPSDAFEFSVVFFSPQSIFNTLSCDFGRHGKSNSVHVSGVAA